MTKLIIPKNKKTFPKRYFPDYDSSILRSPSLPPLSLDPTISEMTGPVFKRNLVKKNDNDLTKNFSVNGDKPIGQEIYVHGYVKDQFDKPQNNVLIEIWQANAGGKYRHRNDKNNVTLDKHFSGCGRFMTSLDGYYFFKTIQPGAYPFPNRGISWRPMHIHFSLFGQCFVQRLVTQMYFQGDPLIPFCSMINSIPIKSARNSLIANLDFSKTESDKILAYRFDIFLRGKNQTVFENLMEGM